MVYMTITLRTFVQYKKDLDQFIEQKKKDLDQRHVFINGLFPSEPVLTAS